MDIESLSNLFYSSPLMQLSAWLALFNLSITVIEVVADLVLKRKRRWRDSGANSLIFIINILIERTWYGAVMFVFLLPAYYFLSPLEFSMTPWTWLAALILADFSYYWMHRSEHKIRILWAHHSVHHSSEDFNLTVAYRLCLFEGATTWLFLVPMVLLGFNPFQTIVAFLLVVQYQSWIHTEHISTLSRLEGVINTPSAHRVHHGSNQQYLDKNFGGVLMIWDRMFGTYEAEKESVVYGLTKNIKTNNPILITVHEYINIFKDVRRCDNVKDIFRVIFGGLSFKPKRG